MGYHIGVVITLLKHPAGNIKLPLELQSFLHMLRLFDECLNNVRHTTSCLFSQHLRMHRNLTKSKKFQPFFFYNDLKHLLCLIAL